VKEQ